MTTKPLIAHRYGFYQSPCGSLQDDTNASMHSAWIPSLRSWMTRLAEGPFFRLLPTAAKRPLSSIVFRLSSIVHCLPRQSRPFRLSSTAYRGKAASFVYRPLPTAAKPPLSSFVYCLPRQSRLFRLPSTAYCGKAAPFVFRSWQSFGILSVALRLPPG